MVRILDNYNITSIILILLELISNNYNKEIQNNNLFILATLKCLEKKTQNMDKILPYIQVDAILLQIHLLLNKFNELDSNKEIYVSIIDFIKKFIKKIVIFKKERILEDYNRTVKYHFIKDKHIIKMINEYLLNNKEKQID